MSQERGLITMGYLDSGWGFWATADEGRVRAPANYGGQVYPSVAVAQREHGVVLRPLVFGTTAAYQIDVAEERGRRWAIEALQDDGQLLTWAQTRPGPDRFVDMDSRDLFVAYLAAAAQQTPTQPGGSET